MLDQPIYSYNRVEGSLDGSAVDHSDHDIEQAAGDFREVLLADGLGQIIFKQAFVVGVLLLHIGSLGYNGYLGCFFLDPAGGLYAIEAGQPEIHQHQVNIFMGGQ